VLGDILLREREIGEPDGSRDVVHVVLEARFGDLLLAAEGVSLAPVEAVPAKQAATL